MTRRRVIAGISVVATVLAVAITVLFRGDAPAQAALTIVLAVEAALITAAGLAAAGAVAAGLSWAAPTAVGDSGLATVAQRARRGSVCVVRTRVGLRAPHGVGSLAATAR